MKHAPTLLLGLPALLGAATACKAHDHASTDGRERLVIAIEDPY